ncbi:hypothetical protein [Streptomyces abyssomicinicus]|uniref:hypothetical protein n=1 Tax=Streptomyces abyssomicinicus TaxID=574929 RepID=UPI0013E06F75|nr:hypothetical protein [Streptomyces abyssomicinicus]
MEQSIGSNTKPLTPPAAVDPALIPGLTVPVAADGEPEDAVRDAVPEDEAVVEDAAPGTEDAAKADLADPAAAAEDADEAEAAEAGADGGPVPVPDGPVFDAKDFRARIVADHTGIRLSLDDQECDFRWDEVGAVETQTSNLGKRFTVVVHTPDRRWYWIEIDAKSRADVTRWDTELDAVLDAYFEDAAEDVAESPAEDATEEAAEQTAEDADGETAEDAAGSAAGERDK